MLILHFYNFYTNENWSKIPYASPGACFFSLAFSITSADEIMDLEWEHKCTVKTIGLTPQSLQTPMDRFLSCLQ